MAYLSMPDAERFWSRLDKQDDGCWIWRGAIRYYGYGVVAWHGKLKATHRLAWELANGESLTRKQVIAHTCDVPPCCNPAHLFRATHAENQADMARKGRAARGERNPRAVLTTAIVVEARRRKAAGEAIGAIAESLAVNVHTLRKAASGQNWRHVGMEPGIGLEPTTP